MKKLFLSRKWHRGYVVVQAVESLFMIIDLSITDRETY